MNFRVRVTNRKQFEFLVNRMEANPKLAKGLKFCEATGISSNTFTSIWHDLTVGLNSLGPPTRTVKDWQKVWTDYKLKIKNKLAHNKREVNATGGGPNSMKILSPTEETVVKLLSLDKMVNHSVPAFGLPRQVGSAQTSQDTDQLHHISSPPGSPLLSSTLADENEPIDEIIREERENEASNQQNASSSRSSKRKHGAMNDVREELLTRQTEYLKQIVENTTECARYARKAFKLREEESKYRRAYLLQKQKDRQSDLELKIELLKYKKQKLEILERREKRK
ncbi:uncharacterized protein LOC110675807 [Aedes aegypti]|uniref:Regulatory protein zeste n=1 Tax=Aedes aegypti TaxID=7159 RepID=A0A6I8U1V6_AEDAE|nr:uncharacterized protein LOC110675807 [Aedes aegypti]